MTVSAQILKLKRPLSRAMLTQVRKVPDSLGTGDFNQTWMVYLVLDNWNTALYQQAVQVSEMEEAKGVESTLPLRRVVK